VMRLAALAPALQRRLLRRAAEQLGAAIDFPSTEALRRLALAGHAGQKRELAEGLRGERTPRELRLTVEGTGTAEAVETYSVAIPGQVDATAFGMRLRIEVTDPASDFAEDALVRNWRPGDRVRLRHSSGPRKVKEVLERLHVTGSRRALWPVVELDGHIVWMQGVELEPEPGIGIVATPLMSGDGAARPVKEVSGAS